MDAMRRVCFAPVALLVCVAALTACGGGSTALEVPEGAGSSVPLNGAPGSQQIIALPAAGGYGGTIALTFAAATSGVSANVTAGATPPPGVPAPTGTDTPLLFIGLMVSAKVALAALPAFTFTVPGATSQGVRRATQSLTYDDIVEVYDPTNPAAGFQPGESCSINGSTVSCSGGAIVDLTGQQPYGFVLEQHQLSASSGGTASFSVPTPAPIACSPSSDVVGVNQTNVIDCTEQGYGGAFTISVADPTIASVQQSNSATFNFFSVTGVHAGTTTFSLFSKSGGAVSVTITVAQ